MNSLINTNFNRTYNPSGRQNALSDIKRLLTSRDTAAQNKACGYLIEVINRYKENSEEGRRMIEYLLDNDLTVFLCEATSNLDFSLFMSIVTCLRLLWRIKRFFDEEHAAHATSAVLRALAHYGASGPPAAVDTCLHFLCDLFNGISTNKAIPPLSHQSAYSAIQLLACLKSLATQLNANTNVVLSSALVLDALISYQPSSLNIKGSTAKALVEVMKKWFEMLIIALNHSVLVGDGKSDLFFVVTCELGMDVLSLIKLLRHGDQKIDFVQTIIADEQDLNLLKQCAAEMTTSVQQLMSELIVFTKDHQTQIANEEYGVFLKFLLNFFYDNSSSDILPDFCDMMFSKGYLSLLPQVQTVRNDVLVRKASTLVLGELLKVLADKYLNVNNAPTDSNCANDIHMGLLELQCGIEKPQSIGVQLQKGQPYSLLIYMYFYCQAVENPADTTAPLLPFLVEHILRMPKSCKPPPHIIKALWLVFAMSTISNGSLRSLDERVYLEKATDRLVGLLHPDPSIYYTHNPAMLLWALTSQRIPNFIKFNVLSQWLKVEDSLPIDLSRKPIVWELLVNVLIQSDNRTIVENCMETLYVCLENVEDNMKQEFTAMVWTILPNVLSKTLIDDSLMETNICYLLDLATTLLPSDLDQTSCLKTAVLITVIFSKNSGDSEDVTEAKHHFEYVCLKLCLHLLGLANNHKDYRVLLTYVNRVGFLPSVLSATNSADERVACAAIQLLTYVVHYFTRNNYQPKSILQIQTHFIIQNLRRDSTSERGASLLQLVYMVLNSGVNTPLALAYEIGDTPLMDRQCKALRALMFRIQLMLCCRESKNRSSAGWKTLSSIFKHAIVSKNDTKLVAILISQPWTHTLVHFHLSQDISVEFLTFILNWLSLLKITIKKSQEDKRSKMSSSSLTMRTMVLMKKNLAADNQKELIEKILIIVNEILEIA